MATQSHTEKQAAEKKAASFVEQLEKMIHGKCFDEDAISDYATEAFFDIKLVLTCGWSNQICLASFEKCVSFDRKLRPESRKPSG